MGKHDRTRKSPQPRPPVKGGPSGSAPTGSSGSAPSGSSGSAPTGSGGLSRRLSLARQGRGWPGWVAMALMVWVVLAILYPQAIFQGQVFQSSDAVNADQFAVVGDRAMRQGDYPLWNPYLFAGMPSFGSLAYVPFLYPPSVVLNFLQRDLGFAPMTWMLAHLLFGGLGMAWLLSRWRLPVAAQLLGVVIWLLFPQVVAWGVHGHGSKLGAAMYLPWLVGWTLRVMDGAGRRAVAMVGLLLGLQILRGHVQITYYTLGTVAWVGLAAAAWPAELAWRQTAAAVRWRRLGGVAAGLVLGFLVGSIMLVPVQQYAKISIRGQDTEGGGGVGLDYATAWSLSPRELGTLVLPDQAGFGKATYLGPMPFNDYPNYFGFLTLALAALAWRQGQRRWLATLAILAVLAGVVSLGEGGFGLYELLYRWLPFFNKFRVPSMILVLPAFVLAVLAPRGIAAWAQAPAPARRPWLIPSLLAGLGLVLLLGGSLGLARSGYMAQLSSLAASAGRQPPDVLLQEAWRLHQGSLIRIGLVLLAAGAAIHLAVRREGFRRRGLIWTVAVLVAVDLLGVDARIVHPERSLMEVVRDASGQGRLQPAGAPSRKPTANTAANAAGANGAAGLGGPQAAELQEAVGHDRVWPLGQDGGRNTWMADGIRSLGGYHAAKLASYQTIRERLYAERPAGRLANWLGARVVTFDQPFQSADLALLADLGLDLEPQPLNSRPPYFYSNRAALPRARLATSWRPQSALPQQGALGPFLDAIQSGEVPMDGPVVLDQDPGLPLPGLTADSPALPAPTFVTDGLDEVVLAVDLPRPAILVLADMAAPGWQVEVDGQSAALLRADLVLRAVAVPAGAHEVRFHYADPAVTAGLSLTLAGAVLCLGLLVWPRRRSERPSERNPVAQGETAGHE